MSSPTAAWYAVSASLGIRAKPNWSAPATASGRERERGDRPAAAERLRQPSPWHLPHSIFW